jgi:hypothetical protein
VVAFYAPVHLIDTKRRKQVQNGNENDTDGAVDFFVVLYVNYGCFK